MFVGGGVGGVWRRDYEVKWFYEGYGQAEINQTALSYYRFERIVQDIGETCEEIFATTRSGEDHSVMLEQLAKQFEPANVVEIAYDTDRQLHAANKHLALVTPKMRSTRPSNRYALCRRLRSRVDNHSVCA